MAPDRVLLALVAFALSCDGGGEPACDTAPTGECVLDACASEGADEADARACCVEEHGYGLTEPDLERLETGCEREACDPEQYLSAASAVCLAQVYGLEAGLAGCDAFLWEKDESYEWVVQNVLETECPAPGEVLYVAGDAVRVDALTGELNSYGGWLY